MTKASLLGPVRYAREDVTGPDRSTGLDSLYHSTNAVEPQMAAVRADPRDYIARSMLADALEELGETDVARAHRWIAHHVEQQGQDRGPAPGMRRNPYPSRSAGGSVSIAKGHLAGFEGGRDIYGHLGDAVGREGSREVAGSWRDYPDEQAAYRDLGRAIQAYEQAKALAAPPQGHVPPQVPAVTRTGAPS